MTPLLGLLPPSPGVTARLRVLAALVALLPAIAVAADIVDPTLPPAPMRAEAAPRGTEPSPAESPRVQMIVRGPGETRTAILDGRALKVGDSVSLDGGTARVIHITEGALVVRRADHRTETIELAPGSARAVRCTRVVGVTALPCASTGTPGLEKTQ